VGGRGEEREGREKGREREGGLAPRSWGGIDARGARPPNLFWCILGINLHPIFDCLMTNNFLCLLYTERIFKLLNVYTKLGKCLPVDDCTQFGSCLRGGGIAA